MNWRRGNRYWIESDTHTVAKIIITQRGDVGDLKLPRVLYEVWRKPTGPGGRAVRLEGHHETADLAKAEAERDARA